MAAPHSEPELSRSLAALGLAAGDCVMLHASFRALGPLERGPET